MLYSWSTSFLKRNYLSRNFVESKMIGRGVVVVTELKINVLTHFPPSLYNTICEVKNMFG